MNKTSKRRHSYLATLALTLAILFAYGAPAAAEAAGIVTLTFDDGNASQYTIPAPIMKAADQKAVFYINSGLVGQASYMTWAQVTDLIASGFEIAGHTLNHTELPTLTPAALAAEVNQDHANFLAHGITPVSFASPFGAYDNETLAVISKKYDSHRAFANQGLNIWPYNKYLLTVRYITNQTSVAQVQAWVNEAVTQDAWLVLVFHEILATVDPTDDYSWETAKFQSFITSLNAQGIKARTIQDVLNQYASINTNSSFESGLAGWTTNNPAGVVLDTAENGSYPAPKNSIKMTAGANAEHLFGEKLLVDTSTTYGLRAYTDSRGFISGEAGFYIDEYDAAGNWISGKWLGGITNKNVVDKSYVYKPTSSSVHSLSIQVYMMPGSGSIFIDNVEIFPKTPPPPPPPVDACPNVPGNQSSGPCADEECVANGGTWNGESCTLPPPPPVDVCPNVPGEQTSGPCADEECAVAGGTWNGTSCDMPPPPPLDVCPNVPGVQESGPCADEECVAAGGTWNGGSCDMPPPPPTNNLVANPSFEDGFVNWTTDNAANVTLDTAGNGSAPAATNSIKMNGNTRAAHLFGEKIPVAFGTSYNLKAHTNSMNLNGGEVGFYIDEYDTAGNWISGKWINGFTTKSITERSYVFTPTSGNVSTAAVQVYMIAAASGHIFVDNIEFLAL